jgi:tRNA (5-methylaminomethyl-2-thiouridylate)-methyltransferase
MNIAVLVSGGVDSAVALSLLQQEGHSVTAYYLKIWLEDELAYLGDCPWQEDLFYVEAICKKLNVPLEIISLQKEYHNLIVTHVVERVKAGFTPNPDMLCNFHIKFGVFLDAFKNSDFSIATGHYAQTRIINNHAQLWASPDAVKDQTYFLAHLTQAQLQRTYFPLGLFTKDQVRAMAATFDLPNKDRKDSQGICFLGTIKFRDFIKHHCGTRKGSLIEIETGTIVGAHEGFWFYTIGQRQGLGLPGGPWYVADKKPEENTVYISRNYYAQDKKRDRFIIDQCNWISEWPQDTDTLTVKLRHGSALYQCSFTRLDNNRALVVLNANDQGIAPGQYAVFYNNGQCLGLGVMQSALSSCLTNQQAALTL